MMDKKDDFLTCDKCMEEMMIHQIKILNMYFEIGVYCDNPECERFKVLMIP